MGILIASTNILTSAAPAMSYCINPTCPAPAKNSPTTNFCMSCGSKILLKDRYRALKLLGQGGFGKTFKAVDEDQPRKPLCVIKQFVFSNNHPETRKIALKLFYEEAQHLEALGKHDQIPELLAYFDVEGQPYLVQQFIDGQDLEQELATAGTFNQTQIRELLESLLPVLDFLHHQSPPVIHRDIKPANIIRRRSDGGFVLVDFGAAKQATQSMLAKTGTAIGSAEFAAPEQARRKPVFASDIYSLGVTCIYLLTQVSPFDLFDMNQDAWVWRDYLVGNPVDEKLGKVLDKMIANSLSQRYKLVVEVLSTLGRKAVCSNDLSLINTIPQQSKVQPDPKSILQLTERQENRQENRQKFSFETVKVEIVVNKNIFFGLRSETKIKIVKIPTEAECINQYLGNGINIEMVYIPSGIFMMGSNESEDEKPIHQVIIKPFYMGKYTITQQQYQSIMGENPSIFKGDNRPVECVSWDDAVEFCQELSKRVEKQYTLPSESQWEYACRAKTTTSFYFGETITSDLANYNGNHSYGTPNKGKYRKQTSDVDSFPPNAFGLYGMHGNIWEWCLDKWCENYNDAPMDGSAQTESDYHHEDHRSVRGASWQSYPDNCRSAYRMWSNRDRRVNKYGFRVVCPSSVP
jgi:formylglycine-generating enzyme required for sulfatase activity/DNA-directed RNA polymerase subunit RPC12/RpoP